MYSLIIPPDLVKELFYLREKTDISIRKHIIDAINFHIKRFKDLEQKGKKTNI